MTSTITSAIRSATERLEYAVLSGESRGSTADAVAAIDIAALDLERYQAAGKTVARVVREALTYRPDADFGFFHDLATRDVDIEARDRLVRHAREVADLSVLEARDIGTGALNGITPPSYVVEGLQAGARPLRTVADAISMPMPDSGMSVLTPTVTSGMTANAQSAQNAAFTASDPTVANAAQSAISTIAAVVNGSRQLILRGGAGVDVLIGAELGGALAAEVERQVLNGSGSSGELQGYLQMGSTGSVTYTSASPTAAEMLPKLGALATSSSSGAKRRADFFVMHSRRLDYLLSRAESTLAHAVTPPAPGDPAGTAVRILGIPVLTCDAVPTTISTNQDAIIAVHRNDAWLFETPPIISTIEVGAPQTFRLTVLQYAALPIRNAAGIAKMTGTGLAATA
jgi:HK97 family phage major capsid protein